MKLISLEINGSKSFSQDVAFFNCDFSDSDHLICSNDPFFIFSVDQFSGYSFLFLSIEYLIDGVLPGEKIKLYWDDGNGFNEKQSAEKPISSGNYGLLSVRVPFGIKRVRVDPISREGKLKIDILRAIVGEYVSVIEMLSRKLRDEKMNSIPIDLFNNLLATFSRRSDNSFVDFLQKLNSTFYSPYKGLKKLDFNSETKEIAPQNDVNLSKLLNDQKVSIIIPFKDNLHITRRCVESILDLTEGINFEILLINNASIEKMTIDWLNQLKSERIKRLDYNEEFNYSAINNFAAASASGNILCLLNNDIEVFEKNWLLNLVHLLLSSDSNGIVGSLLLYPDQTIQHAGVFITESWKINHILKNIPYDESIIFPSEVQAVTGACMAMRKKLFTELGGLSEELSIAYNDIDLCTKARKSGFKVKLSSDSILIHLESKSRGLEQTIAKRKRQYEELNIFKTKHKEFFLGASRVIDFGLIEYIEATHLLNYFRNLEESRQKSMVSINRLDAKKNTIIIYNSNRKTANKYITDSILKSLQNSTAGYSIVYVQHLADLVNTCKMHKPSLLLILDGQNLLPKLIKRAKIFADRVVLWCFDDPYVRNQTKNNQYLFDHIYTNDFGSQYFYDVGCTPLPLAAGSKSELVKQERHLEATYPEFDVFFCGSAWSNRVESIQRLINSLPELKYKISMPYKKELKNNKPLESLHMSDYIFGMSYEDCKKYMQKSAITLCLMRANVAEDNSHSPCPRFFEAAGQGAFQIVLSSSDTLDPYLKKGLCYLQAKNDQDLINKVQLSLNFPAIARRIASNALQIASKHHTYENRLNTILEHHYARTDNQPYFQRKSLSSFSRKKTRLIHCIHNTIASKVYGGLEIHQNTLMNNILQEYEVFVMCFEKSEHNSSRQTAKLYDSQFKLLSSIECSTPNINKYWSDSIANNWFSQILDAYNIELVHFFHLINVPLSFPFITYSHGVPYIYSIHDFNTICDSFTLLDWQGQYCNIDLTTQDKCAACLAKRSGWNAKDSSQSLQFRRTIMSRVLGNASEVIYMSKSCQDIMERNFPQLRDVNSSIAGAPLPNKKLSFYADNLALQDNLEKCQFLKILVPGNISKHKGGKLLLKALPHLNANKKIYIDIWGSVDSEIKAELDSLNLPSNILLKQCGRYEPGTLKYSHYHISLHLSIWPETYCQTLSESWASSIVPICSNIGALGERVTHLENGLLFDCSDHEDLARQINLLISPEGQALHAKIRRSINERLYLNQTQHAEYYLKSYSSHIENVNNNYNVDYYPHPSHALVSELMTKEKFNFDDIDSFFYRRASWHPVQNIHPADLLALPEISHEG